MLLAEADTFLSALYPVQPLKVFDLNTAFTILRETRTDDAPAVEEEGELAPFTPIPDPFPKSLVDETRNWLAAKFEIGATWQADFLLKLAREDGFQRRPNAVWSSSSTSPLPRVKTPSRVGPHARAARPSSWTLYAATTSNFSRKTASERTRTIGQERGGVNLQALQTSLTTAGDMEYRELAALFRVDANFRRMCEDVAAGLTLQIIDASELRGLVLVPESKDSRFAVRLGDIRAHGMEQPHRAALVLAHVAICAAFFPTSDSLDDDSLIPPPVTIASCRDTLYSLAQRLKEANPLPTDVPLDLAPGWEAVCASSNAARKRPRSVFGAGIVKIALNQMVEGARAAGPGYRG